jgi:hypothetical protein
MSDRCQKLSISRFCSPSTCLNPPTDLVSELPYLWSRAPAPIRAGSITGAPYHGLVYSNFSPSRLRIRHGFGPRFMHLHPERYVHRHRMAGTSHRQTKRPHPPNDFQIRQLNSNFASKKQNGEHMAPRFCLLFLLSARFHARKGTHRKSGVQSAVHRLLARWSHAPSKAL